MDDDLGYLYLWKPTNGDMMGISMIQHDTWDMSLAISDYVEIPLHKLRQFFASLALWEVSSEMTRNPSLHVGEHFFTLDHRIPRGGFLY